MLAATLMSRVRNLLRRIPLFVALVAAGLVVAAAAAIVVFAGGDEKTGLEKALVDPDPSNHEFHVTGISERYAGPAPMKSKFAAKTFNGSGKINWFWRFDDGAVSLERKPEHTFKEPGYYQVLVDAQDEKGNIGRMNVFIGVWPRGLWEKAQSGKPYNRTKEVSKQWTRTALRKKRIVANCLKIPVCRRQELAQRRERKEAQRKAEALCRKDPKCVRETRKALRESREKLRRARRLGIPNVPLP
jgi:PKD domain-containing protein